MARAQIETEKLKIFLKRKILKKKEKKSNRNTSFKNGIKQ